MHMHNTLKWINHSLSIVVCTHTHSYKHTSIRQIDSADIVRSSFFSLQKSRKSALIEKYPFCVRVRKKSRYNQMKSRTFLQDFNLLRWIKSKSKASGELIQKNQNARAAVETSEMGIWMWWIMFDVLLSYWA